MERVSSIGGFFFRSRDPGSLQRWYEDVLGVKAVPATTGSSREVQVDPEEYRWFAWTADPEGNRVQLWQPK